MPQPATMLKVLVDQRKWRYVDFARAFAAAAEEVLGLGPGNPTVGESAFRRWTGGKLRGLPGADTCRVLEAMFQVPAETLFGPPPSANDPALPTFDLEAEIAMTARDAQEDANAAAASSISDTTIDQLRDDIVALAGAYNRKSSAEVWTEARRLREEAETQRDRTRIPGQQQDLLVLAGQASALLATAAFDMGSLAGAKRLARTAALYGESARFGPLQAFATGALAYISYFSATPSESVRLVQRGLMCDGLGDVAVRRLRAIEARAYGHLGDTASAQRAVALSEDARSGRTDELHEVVGGEFGFSDERLAMSNSSTALLVGNGEQAEASALRALELLSAKSASARSARVMGGAAADLAMARLLHNDLEGAAEALAMVWDVPVDQRATGLLHRISQLRSTLTLPRYQGATVAGDLAERIEGFVLASSARSLDGPYGPMALEP